EGERDPVGRRPEGGAVGRFGLDEGGVGGGGQGREEEDGRRRRHEEESPHAARTRRDDTGSGAGRRVSPHSIATAMSSTTWWISSTGEASPLAMSTAPAATPAAERTVTTGRRPSTREGRNAASSRPAPIARAKVPSSREMWPAWRTGPASA